MRWLLAKKYNSKALKIIKKAAEVNKTGLSEDLLAKFAEHLENDVIETEKLEVRI